MNTPQPTRAPQRCKHWCKPCDYVCKGGGTCPTCRQPMTNMGMMWKPGKKGRRAEYVPPWRPAYWWSFLAGDARTLEAKLSGEIVFDRTRGRWRRPADL